MLPSQAAAVVELAAPNFRGTIAVPAGAQGDAVRAFPELLGFAIVTGVVPTASDGRYEVVPR